MSRPLLQKHPKWVWSRSNEVVVAFSFPSPLQNLQWVSVIIFTEPNVMLSASFPSLVPVVLLQCLKQSYLFVVLPLLVSYATLSPQYNSCSPLCLHRVSTTFKYLIGIPIFKRVIKSLCTFNFCCCFLRIANVPKIQYVYISVSISFPGNAFPSFCLCTSFPFRVYQVYDTHTLRRLLLS